VTANPFKAQTMQTTGFTRANICEVEGGENISKDELKLLIKYEFVKHSKELQRIQREIEAF
jgi:hypothetical protein